LILEEEILGCPETVATNYKPKLRINPEERRANI